MPKLLQLLLLSLHLFIFSITTSSNSSAEVSIFHSTKCNEADISSLLHFTSSFQLNCSASDDEDNSNLKTSLWNMSVLEADYWKGVGVRCDPITGHVIGVDLRSSCLYGSINSTIFSNLFHLRYLDLAGNNFRLSTIPRKVGNLSRLAHLDLSSSYFIGEIPLEISKLPKLSSLDLSDNELQGEFPPGIFHLPNLQSVNIMENRDLQGYLPDDFNSTSRLEKLALSGTNFSGKIPSSIGNHLVSLKELDLVYCKFSGTIPASLGNLTQLIYLYIGNNDFTASSNSETSLSWLSKLTKLQDLGLSGVKLLLQGGGIPSSLANLTHLSYLAMSRNALNGEIPAWIANLTHLFDLRLDYNSLHGPIPNSIFKMRNVEYLDLFENNLSGALELDMFFQHEKLIDLRLQGNNLTLISRNNNNATLVESERPTSLFHLGIDFNKLLGPFPNLPPSLQAFFASNVEFIGELHEVELPPSICSLSSLRDLALSSSHLTGELPHCFGNFSRGLKALDLRNNSLHGRIPEFCSNNNNNGSSSRLLKMIGLSDNRFEGQLPRSLANCLDLELLDVGNNLINDTFPSWLGSLPHLRVLLLKGNALHGSMGRTPDNKDDSTSFPELRIIDLSYNNLSGELPSSYFQGWDAMKSPNLSSSSIMMLLVLQLSSSELIDIYTITITDKGIKLEYQEIFDALITIDLSHNRFEGRIPTILGTLRGLHLLNLSYNRLTGPIPSSLAELAELQSRDLSSNRLSGDIPQQISQLTSLSAFNVSYNKNLTGPIPHGRQFDTFDNSSYVGESGLCGQPLSRTCGNNNSPMPPHVLQPPPETEMEKHEEKLFLDAEWMVVLIGVVGGLVFGVAMENTFDWRTTFILCWIWKIRWRFTFMRRN